MDECFEMAMPSRSWMLAIQIVANDHSGADALHLQHQNFT
jgi:hypothetical protein